MAVQHGCQGEHVKGRLSARRLSMQALSEPSAVLLWQLGMASSSVAAIVDAWTGRRLVLSSFVLIGPYCVALTGRWLRTALAGAWAICLVVVLGVSDGIWGTQAGDLIDWLRGFR